MNWNRWVGILGFMGVALGAFGAHGLRDHIAPTLLAVYQTGVLYHLVHVVALGGYSIVEQTPRRRWPGLCFIGGITLFSGSLYLMAVSGVRWLGAITPIGGVLFLVGWIGVGLTLPRDSRR